MKKIISGYSIWDDWWITTDKQEFLDAIEVLGWVWFEYPHYFDIDWNITQYRAAIVKVNSYNKEDIDRIKNIYWIEPNIIYEYSNTYHYIFNYTVPVSKADNSRILKTLSIIYNGEGLEYYFYPSNGVSTIFTSKWTYDFRPLTNRFVSILWGKGIEWLTTKDYDLIIKANEIPIVQVIKILFENQLEYIDMENRLIDTKLNLHIKDWLVFDYVFKKKKNLLKTKEFFATNFNIGFQLDWEEHINYDYNVWVAIKEWEDLFFDGKGYAIPTDKWVKSVSDFYFKVFYSVTNEDWEKNYLVSLINPTTWEVSKKVELIQTTSPNKFADFCQKYGNFHFYWSSNNIKLLHKLISNAPWIVDINKVKWYGIHKDLWIIVFKNWIWDIENKIFTERKEWETFYEWIDWQGYMITSQQWDNLEDLISQHIPVLNTDVLLQKWELIKAFSELYANEIWPYLLYAFLWMAWYILYWDKKDNFPILFTKWWTWFGKTVANSLIQYMFGLHNASLDFGNTTAFTFTVLMSNLIQFPIFMTEYRENSPHREVKVGMLRSVFDKMSQWKGKADQTLVKYDYYAMPVMEWEEVFSDPAVRTRSIQLFFKNSKHRIQGDFVKKLEETKGIIKWALYTYLLKSDWKDYDKFLEEWRHIFGNISTEPRIPQNLSKLYAGAMCFMSDKKDHIIEILTWIWKQQEEDRMTNSNEMQIIKAISRWLSKTWSWVYIKQDKVILSWNLIEDFIQQYKVKLTLDVETYKQALRHMWYEVDIVDTWSSMIEWIVIPFDKIHPKLLAHQDIYDGYKVWKKNNK